MWGESDKSDPGGGGSMGPTKGGAPSPQEVAELKDQNEQQLLLIAQLKEMLRKEQSSVSQEKVEEYVNTLSKARAKKSKQNKTDESGTSQSKKTVTANIDSNKKERINFLRQQMEENKARLAERGKSQKGIEKMVTELQAQLNDSSQFSSPLNISFSETKTIEYNENTSQKELYNILITKERKISELTARSQKLENTVLDLQENVKEKDSVIDARTKAITLMTESLSKKGKCTLDALDETKEQMRKMQENFVTLEAEMKARQLTLLNDLKSKNMEISDLQEMNESLQRRLLKLTEKQDDVDSSRIIDDFKEEFNQTKAHNEELLGKINELEQVIDSMKSSQDCSESFQEELEKTKSCNSELLSKISQLEGTIESLKSSISEDNLSTELEKYKNHNEELLQKIVDLEREQQQHLLDDLEVKNRLEGSYKEIADILSSVQNELEETKLKLNNEKKASSEEIERLTKQNAELEKQLQEALSDLNLLKSTGNSSKRKEDESKEIEKLKRQLDESNKSMIKMRAQQKGKIKELNKKLEQFKKMNDANALIAQLQTVNSKLGEKIAELEEEKGNMQLKMVESTGSLKDPEYEEQIKNLQDLLSRVQEELSEKDKVIEILESDLITAKQQLKEEAISTQVSSEMSSIQYEEQLEKIEDEKKQLQTDLESLNREKEELLETIEMLKKEKQELNTKLENYIQENMELIDKLEKLSAEKVSSAESIEMVEGLTQQEKLELAAYQKIIGHEEVSKCTEDDHMESPAELNESVLQLGEETAELMQKIEMFTRERKEVMHKMDSLKEENDSLNVKVKEIENNHDILAETYEQLQNEKEALLNEKEELIAKLKSISDKASAVESNEPAEGLQDQLNALQVQYEELLEDNSQLKKSLKDLDLNNQEKFNLEEELKASRQLNDELEVKLRNHIEEINNYGLIIEENKTELINSSQLIADLQSKLQEREKDIDDLNANINDLNVVISELQNKNRGYELMEAEIEQLKSGLGNQLDQAQEYEAELNQNNEVIKSLNAELAEMNRRILERQNELDAKDSEIEKLKQDILYKEEFIKDLQSAIEAKDRSFKTLSEEIKSKYLGLQQQLDSNSDMLQKQVDELQHKNKDQLEKMKKLAANLKKKTQSYHELETQYNNDKTKWDSELQEKNTQLQLLEQTNVDQQNYILQLKQKEEKLNEVNLQKEMSESLHEEINNDNVIQQQVLEEKIRELEMMLETTQTEIQHYTERIETLEETLKKLDEEKSTFAMKNLELEEKLNLTSNSFKEKALLEDQLELRLAEITASDETLQKKLNEVTKEHEELLKKQQESEELIKKLKIKLKKSQDKVTELKANQKNTEELETANAELKKHLATLEANYRQIQSENESLQRRNVSDYERIEADYQIQLEELLKAKNDLTVECEKLQEKLKEFAAKEEEFMMEIEEYKLRVQETDTNTEEVIRLSVELEMVNSKLHNALTQISELSQEISTLMEEITVLRTAKASVEDIVQEAIEKVSQKIDGSSQTDEVPKTEGTTVDTNNAALTSVQWPNQPSEFDSNVFDTPNVATEPQVTSIQNYFSKMQGSEKQDVFEPFAQVVHQDNLLASLDVKDQQNTQSADEVNYDTPTASNIDDSHEALMKKIKALEFLLFNADKENAALTQCAEMVTELADMIYEKANISQSHNAPPSSDLESQILSDAQVTNMSNKQTLENLEYQPAKMTQGEQSQVPVQEEILQSRNAYLCFDENSSGDLNWEHQPVKMTHGEHSQVPIQEETLHPRNRYVCFDENASGDLNLESQIMSQQQIDTLTHKKELHNLEYQQADPSLGEQRHQVVEPVAKAQQAYLCYSKDEKQQSLEENDDGWGWGPEEGRLEEEHMSSVEHIPQVRNLQLEIQSLRENLKVMQLEKEHHLDEIKQLQIKSGKLIKKCKELKLKSEQMPAGPSTKTDDGGFFDLNETIQDELKQQVQKLEKKLKEITAELDKEKLEKNNLLKKVDVLTSANDRMVEMKEIQDAEVHRWQRKCRETEEKLEQHEWGNDDFGGPKKPTDPSTSNTSTLDDVKIQELEQVVRDLTLDNEELQSLLEEQRNLRLEAEKKKDVVPEKDIDNSIDLQRQIEEQSNSLSEVTQELENIISEKKSMEQEIFSLKMSLQEKENVIAELQESKKLKKDNQANNNVIAELQFEQAALQEQIQNLNEQLAEKDEYINQMSMELSEIAHSKIELENQIERLNEHLASQNKATVEFKTYFDENTTIKQQLKELEISIEDKEERIDQLNQIIVELRNEQNLWEATENQLKSMIAQKDKNIDELLNEKHQKEFDNTLIQSQENQRLVEELKKKDEELDKLLSQIEADETLLENLKAKEKEVEELTQQISDKDKEFESKVNDLQQTNEQSALIINELNVNWQIQVDQRGAEVAELWKNHLASVESEFAATREKLTFDVSELEERCNILVNENNELRKNVDAEIRNEVDKLSALHQQITTHQQTIASLQMALQEKQNGIDELRNNSLGWDQEIQSLQSQLAEKDLKLASMDLIVDTTQKQLDEKRQVVEEIVSILEKKHPSPLPYENQSILEELKRQLASGHEYQSIIDELNNQLTSHQEKEFELGSAVKSLENQLLDITGKKDREITGLNQVIEDFEKELSVVHEKEAEISRLNSLVDQITLERDALAQELQKLQHEHSNCRTVLENNVQKLGHLQATCDSLEHSLQEKEKIIENLNYQLSQISESATNDSNKEIQRLSSELQQSKQEYSDLHQHLTETQNQVQELSQNLSQKIQDYENVSQQLNYYQQTIAMKDEEINRLQTNLQDKEIEHNTTLSNIQQSQYAEVQNYYEQQLSAKDLDNQQLRALVHELESNNHSFAAKSQEDDKVKEDLEKKLEEQTKLVDEDTKQMEELKLIIEDQVAKIEELKQQLFEKSGQFDSLIAEMDMGRPGPVTNQPVASIQQASPEKSETYTEEDLSEPVNRAELDLALYMLHQRDVRCEELTVELTQLLEERDTLQLRLSNAIREKEEIRRKLEPDTAVAPTVESVPYTTSKSSNIFLAASGTELAEDPLQSDKNLATKLSELKNVGYKKDKTFVDEQDARRLQQMAIMQQHIKEASKLPPEAAAKLVNASYTLSRDVQSPSKVLLNWLWGNSTPKAGES